MRFFGGLSPAVPGRGQQALLLRLAIDAGTAVGYRALAEDVWPVDAPDDPRAALQSLASRLRRALPEGALESTPGGYRLALTRDDVDITRFADLVAAARRADPIDAASLADDALALWSGDPWTPGDGFDWLVRDLLEDRAHAEKLSRPAPAPAAAPFAPLVPAAITSLVGRDAELAAIAAQLGADRLVTLLGPGGAGKTTLATETARRHTGSVIVELAPAAPGEVWAAIAGAVGRSIRLPESSNLPVSATERVREALAGRRLLVVLDNCEHVSREAAEAAVALLGMSPGARVLATSREPLGVAGEAFVDLGPLPSADAEELFARRTRAARGSAPTPKEHDTVARIVRRLDGLPLAIELAAARTRTLTLGEIDAGLDDRFALLSAGPRLSSDRHRTLRALIDWSWDTLTNAERTALRAAAVFPDGIGTTDAARVAGAFGIPADAFDALVDRSLLTRRDGRFRMLETVRAYGLDRLRAAGDEAAYRARETRVLVELAEERDAISRGPRVREALTWFDANEENVTAALRACADAGDRASGVRLVRALLWVWVLRERFEELQRGLAAFADPDAPLDSEPEVVVETVALMMAAFLAPEAADDAERDAARARLDAAAPPLLDAARRHPSELTAALVPLLTMAQASVHDPRDMTAWSTHVHIDDTDLEGVPAWTRAFLDTVRAGAAQNSGDVEGLGRYSERAVAGFRALDDPWGIGFASQLLSEWLMLEGRLEEALEVSDRSTAAIEGLTSAADVVQQRTQSVALLVRLGRVEEARERSRRIDAVAAADGSDRAIAQADMNTATVEIALGDGAAALRAIERVHLTGRPGVPEQLLAWRESKRAQALLLLGRTDDARGALREATPIAVRTGDQPIVSDVVLSVAGWLALSGRTEDAQRALAASAALRGRVDEHDPFRAWVLAHLDTTTAPEEISPGTAVDVAALMGLLD